MADHENNPLRSVQEARSYLEKLRQTIRYIDISDCLLEKGQFRCDVNISIRPEGAKKFGNRAEIKNMSSFRFIADALEYEIGRQKEIIESGGEIHQETRLFDEVKKVTMPMRSKEDAPDYRYFPDPDLLEVEIDDDFIRSIENNMPELPDQKLKRIIGEYKIPRYDALILTRDKEMSDFFSKCASVCDDKKKLSNWIIKELFRLLNDSSLSISECPVQTGDFSDLVNLISRGEITEIIARTVLEEMFRTGEEPDRIIKSKRLKPIADDDVLKKILNEVFSENRDAVEQLKAGETKPIDFLMGQVMRKTKGKADPQKVRKMIKDLI